MKNTTEELMITDMTVMDKINDKLCDAGARAMLTATNVTGKVLSKKWGKMLLTVPLALSMMAAITACAEDGKADSFINEVIALLKTWIPRLGGMIVVVGGIQFGIGFKDDDSTGKTRGMQTMIGGAIVAAIGGLVDF